MAGKVFVDTNVLVYAYDRSDPEKNRIAGGVVQGLWETGLGVVSTQVLQEFYVTVTSKVPKPLPAEDARTLVEDLLKWEVFVNDGGCILSAIGLQKRLKYAFRDCLIINAAIESGAGTLASEDLADGQEIKGVQIVNPFGTRRAQAGE